MIVFAIYFEQGYNLRYFDRHFLQKAAFGLRRDTCTLHFMATFDNNYRILMRRTKHIYLSFLTLKEGGVSGELKFGGPKALELG